MSKRVFHAGPEGTVVAEENEGPQAGRQEAVADMAFSTHVISLNAMALMSMGLMDEGAGEVDKESARHAIDTLAMLEHKTQGNLTREEDRLLKAVLSELRLKYLELK